MMSNPKKNQPNADDDEDVVSDADQPEGADPSNAGDAEVSVDENVKTLLAERDKYLELARRTQAEFENYQKRIRRDWETERKFAAQPVVSDLLPVLDNLERAMQSAPADESAQQFTEGVRLVHKQWIDVLAKHGVEPIPTVGEPFDPNQHEAIMQQPSDEYPPMTVLVATRSGYRFHDRILRPAQVIVSSASAS